MELVTIKWLLVAILICTLLIAISLVVLAGMSVYGFGALKEVKKVEVFQKKAEHYLSNGDFEYLTEIANDRIKTSPQDYLAYWYLGKVQYHQEDYVESKRNFLKVIKLDPTMDYSASQWIEEIDEKLELGPQLVN